MGKRLIYNMVLNIALGTLVTKYGIKLCCAGTLVVNKI